MIYLRLPLGIFLFQAGEIIALPLKIQKAKELAFLRDHVQMDFEKYQRHTFIRYAEDSRRARRRSYRVAKLNVARIVDVATCYRDEKCKRAHVRSSWKPLVSFHHGSRTSAWPSWFKAVVCRTRTHAHARRIPATCRDRLPSAGPILFI